MTFRAKLPNIFGSSDNSITITQAEHGKNQDNKAMDIRACPLICPYDGCTTSRIYGTGEQRYFYITLPNGDQIECVHGIPTRVGTEFRKGEVIGQNVPYSKGEHWHISLLFKPEFRWDVLLHYIDRETELKLSGDFKPTEQHYKNWDRYPDSYLIFDKNPNMEEEYNNFLTWNNKILEKKIVKEKNKYTSTGNFSKLINKTENLSEGQQELAIQLEKLKNIIQVNKLDKNWTTTVMGRFNAYVNESGALY